MKVCCITCTAGRYSCLQRSVRMFLEQDYYNCVQLIYQNSHHPLILDSSVPKDKVILINQDIDSETDKPYTTLGAIYRDAFKHVPMDVDIINHMDDDDIFLPNHISEGVKGVELFKKSAYKPKKSYYITDKGKLILMENTLEPSIFVKKWVIDAYGYGIETSAQHLKWIFPLIATEDIESNPEGIPTMIYDWNTTGINVYKTSGNQNSLTNFRDYRAFSTNYGDGVLVPITKEDVEKYYKLIK